jgi:nitrate/nitrite transport system substrate-binding protein
MPSPGQTPRPPARAPAGFPTLDRRRFLQGVALAGLSLPAASLLSACGGSDSSEGSTGGGGGRKVTLGFIPLTDCAPLVVAFEKGFFKDRDLDVTLENGKSWPSVRDKLLNGEFDGSHCLYTMPLSVATGVSKIEGATATQKSLRVAMMLNENGQAITLASDLADCGYADLDAAKETLTAKKPKSLGMTFPGGTHDLWLRYWLKAVGVDPQDLGIEIKPIPPPDMFANLNQENVRGYCVGEPWNARAVLKKKGFTTLATQDLWKHHPEKALVVNEKFATEKADVLKDVMAAVIEAQKWLDKPENTKETAKIIGVPKYVNATPEEIEGRLGGTYDFGEGAGEKDFGDLRMRFFRDGLTPFPRQGNLIWAMTQYVRFGYLPEMPDPALADELILTDVYADVAEKAGIDVPDDAMAPIEIALDEVTFDPSTPDTEAARA